MTKEIAKKVVTIGINDQFTSPFKSAISKMKEMEPAANSVNQSIKKMSNEADKVGRAFKGAFQDSAGRWHSVDGHFISLKKSASNLGMTVDDLKRSLTKMGSTAKQETESSNRSFGKFHSAIHSTFSTFGEFGRRGKRAFSDIRESSEKAHNRISTFKSTLLGIFAGGVILSGIGRIKDALVELGQAGIEYNKEQEVMSSTWNTLTGSAGKGKAMVDSVNSMSVAFGQSADLVNELDQQFYHVFDNQPRTEKLTRAVLTLGDTLGMSSESLNRLGLNFTHMLSSGRMQLGDFNMITDQLPMYGHQLLEYEQKVQHNSRLTMSELRKEMSAGKISAHDAEVVMEQLGNKYQKASENMMKTLPGMERVIKSRMPALIGAFEKPIMKAQSGIMGAISKWASSKRAENEFNQLGKSATIAFNRIETGFEIAFGFGQGKNRGDSEKRFFDMLAKGIEDFGTKAQYWILYIDQHKKNIADFFNQVKDAGVTAFKLIIPVVEDTTKVMKPMLDLALKYPKAFAAIATAVVIANKTVGILSLTFGGLWKVIKTSWNFMKKFCDETKNTTKATKDLTAAEQIENDTLAGGTGGTASGGAKGAAAGAAKGGLLGRLGKGALSGLKFGGKAILPISAMFALPELFGMNGNNAGSKIGGFVGNLGGGLAGASAGGALGTAIFPGVGTAIGSLVGGIAGSVGGQKFLSSFGGWVQKHWRSVAKPFSDLGGALKHDARDVQTAWNNIPAFFARVGIGLGKFTHTVTKPFRDLGHAISQDGRDIRNGWNGLPKFFRGIWGGIKGAFGGVGTFFHHTWSGTVGIVKRGWGGVSGFFRGIWRGIRISWGGVSSFFHGIWGPTVGIAKRGWSGVAGFFRGIWRGIRRAWGGVGSFFKGIWGPTVGIAKRGWSGVAGFFRGTWRNIRRAWSGVAGFFHGAWGGTVGIVKKGWSSVPRFFRGIWGGIKSAWHGVSGFFRGIGNGMLKGIGRPIQGVIKGINYVLNHVGASKFDLHWKIPQFAAGGRAQGLFVAGEKGHELMKDSRGRITMTPDKPTLYHSRSPVKILGTEKTRQAMKSGLIPKFSGGNWLGTAWDFLKSGMGTVANIFMHPVKSLEAAASRFVDLGNLSSAPLHIAQGAVKTSIKHAADWIKNKVGALTNIGGSGAKRWTPYVVKALSMTGLPTTAQYINAWLRQISSESGGNPSAVQHGYTDINSLRGDLAKGLLQTISATFNAFKLPGHGNIFNGFDNILAAMRYAISRYGKGGILSVIGHGHGYANGGYVRASQLAAIAEDGGEYVINPRKKNALSLVASALQDIKKNQPTVQMASLDTPTQSYSTISGQQSNASNHYQRIENMMEACYKMLYAIARKNPNMNIDLKALNKMMNNITRDNTYMANYQMG